jgi:hypothetical protein
MCSRLIERRLRDLDAQPQPSKLAHLGRIEIRAVLGDDESRNIAEPPALIRTHVDARHLERIVVLADRQSGRRQLGGKHRSI